MGEFQGVFKRDKHGDLIMTPAGAPSKSQKRLREILSNVADEHDITPPKTTKGELSLGKNFWQQHADTSPFIELWQLMEAKSKLLQFFRNVQEKRIHPRYSILVRTGRTSCHGPNIQQMPRDGTFREMFVPRPGHVFLIIDYAALELRTLAAVCECRYGYSMLGDTIRAGQDPHCYTAALIDDLAYDEFMALKTTDPARFKLHRQASKAVNFGVPGGLGAVSLSQYAKFSYGVELTENDAEQFRELFLTEIYPEIGEYMASDALYVLAENLKCKVRDVRMKFRTDAGIGGMKRIVQGWTHKRDGEPYSSAYMDHVWNDLREINNNERLELDLLEERAGYELERRLCFGIVVAPAGFIRGRTTYCQRRNTPFQSCAATGAKIALWKLFRKGYRLVAFVHDEFVIELPRDADHTAEAERIDDICCRSMEAVTGKVPIACEYSLSRRWYKQAEAVFENDGQLVVWEPNHAE
jgi:DNA polymerase I-like protein with 3'-5' exonuclease and polymerase domains